MKNYTEGLKNESHETITKSSFTVIKAICISLVAFLYGFFCVLAYWDPIGNADKLPVAIINNDKSFLTNDLLSSLITDPVNNTIEIADGDIDINMKYFNSDSDKSNLDDYWNQIIIPETYSSDLLNVGQALVQFLNAQSSTDISTTSIIFKDSVLVLLGESFYDLPPNPSQSIKTYGLENGADYSNHSIQLTSSYEQNFINGEFFYIFDSMKDSFALQLIPSLLTGIMFQTGIKLSPEDVIAYNLDPHNNYASDQDVILIEQFTVNLKTKIDDFFHTVKGRILNFKFPELHNLLDNILDFISNESADVDSMLWQNPTMVVDKHKIVSQQQMNENMSDFINIDLLPANPDKFIEVNITGADDAKYGIGLGEFFLLIAIWLGAIIQTFIFNRKYSITKKTHYFSSYFAKYTIFLGMSLIQTTILMLGVFSIGYNYLHMVFFYYYLWMLFATFIISTIVYSLWMTFSDENIGKFVAILYMVLNLCAGWGTFPSFMQYGVFNVISYICPFKYIINGEGSILYNVFYFGTNNTSSSLILSLAGYLLLFAIFFMAISVVVTKLRMFHDDFGTLKKDEIYQVISKNNWKDLIVKDKLNVNKKFVGKIKYSNLSNENILEIKNELTRKKEKKDEK